MKTIQKTMLIILLTASYSSVIKSQNLDKLPQAKRDSILIAVAKEIVLKYGPDYYREYKPPVIKRSIYPKGIDDGKDAGRIVYSVSFLYDKTKELLEKDYAAAVGIWADTGKPYTIFFGDGWIRLIPETDLRSAEEIEQTPYQERQVIPLYDWQNHPENPNPINIDELRKKGYVEKADKQWIKTRPDTPPAEAIKAIKRNGYEERNGRWIKVRQETLPAKSKK